MAREACGDLAHEAFPGGKQGADLGTESAGLVAHGLVDELLGLFFGLAEAPFDALEARDEVGKAFAGSVRGLGFDGGQGFGHAIEAILCRSCEAASFLLHIVEAPGKGRLLGSKTFACSLDLAKARFKAVKALGLAGAKRCLGALDGIDPGADVSA